MSAASYDGVAFCLSMPLVVIGMYTDFIARRISNRLNVILLLTGVGAQLVARGGSGLGQAAGGAGLGLASLLPFYAMGAIGAGDVKFMAAIGAWLGISGLWVGLLAGTLLAGLVAVVRILRSPDRTLYFGNMSLIANKLVSGRLLDPSVAGHEQLNQDRLSMPYGFFLGIGSLAVLGARAMGVEV